MVPQRRSFCDAFVGPPSIGDASTFVGPMFENEARDAVNALRPKLFPWATAVTAFVSRDDVGGDGGRRRPRQFDLFAYSDGDDARPCVDDAGNGVRVVWPSGRFDHSPALAKPDMLLQTTASPTASPPASSTSSSRDETSPVDDNPGRKYVVGEVYSGWSADAEREKCNQLEGELAVLSKRFCDRTSSKPVDITQLVGAALLVFAMDACSAQKRPAQLSSVVKRVQTHAGPLMRRLMHAGRLVVMLMCPDEAPVSAAERSRFAVLKGILAWQAHSDSQRLASPLVPPASAAHHAPRHTHTTETVPVAAAAAAPLGANGLGVLESSHAGWHPQPCRNAACRNRAARYCTKHCCAVCCAQGASSDPCVQHTRATGAPGLRRR